MASGRFRFAAAVYGILVNDDGQVLLMRRAGTGYRDGELSLPAGHLDGGEDAVTGLLRELREELTIAADRDSCRLALLLHRAAEFPGDDEYLDLIFMVTRWTGTPAIGEPDKCTGLVWADPHKLPTDLVDYIRAAFEQLNTGGPLLLHGWDAH